MQEGGDSSNFIRDPTAFTALTRVHKSAITDCCFSPDTDQILTGSEDNTVVLWSLPVELETLHDDTINDDHKLHCYRLSDHKAPVLSVAMHQRICISSDRSGTVKLWKLSPALDNKPTQSLTKQPNPEPNTYYCHETSVRSVSFSLDGRSFATGSDDKKVKIWSSECPNKMLVSYPYGHTNWIKCVRWAKTNDRLMASCGDDGKICIWDTRIKVQPPIEVISSRRRMQFNCLDWHPVFDHHLATGAQDSSCSVWDLRNKRPIQVYSEHKDAIRSIAFNSGGSLLLSGSQDSTSKIFDVCEGRNMFTLISHESPITSVCFDRTGELLATASMDRTATIWRRNFETVDIVLDDGLGDVDDEVSTILGDDYDDTTRPSSSSRYY